MYLENLRKRLDSLLEEGEKFERSSFPIFVGGIADRSGSHMLISSTTPEWNAWVQRTKNLIFSSFKSDSAPYQIIGDGVKTANFGKGTPIEQFQKTKNNLVKGLHLAIKATENDLHNELAEQSETLRTMPEPKKKATKVDPKKVFIVHGRNHQIRDAMFNFLRAVGLEPIEWSEAIKMTGQGSPYVGDVLEVAFNTAQAVIVLMTPDDEARLLEQYRGKKEPIYESELTPQPRPNVLLEAGMALGKNAHRTVLIEFGDLRQISDIVGRHTVRLNNSPMKRQDVIDRLETAQCDVKISGRRDWLTVGNFDLEPYEKSEDSKEFQQSELPHPDLLEAIQNLKDENTQLRQRIQTKSVVNDSSISAHQVEIWFKNYLKELIFILENVHSDFASRKVAATGLVATPAEIKLSKINVFDFKKWEYLNTTPTAKQFLRKFPNYNNDLEEFINKLNDFLRLIDDLSEQLASSPSFEAYVREIYERMMSNRYPYQQLPYEKDFNKVFQSWISEWLTSYYHDAYYHPDAIMRQFALMKIYSVLGFEIEYGQDHKQAVLVHQTKEFFGFADSDERFIETSKTIKTLATEITTKSKDLSEQFSEFIYDLAIEMNVGLE